ncbi:MAG: hypothetical protein ACI4V7_01815 [Succinivibrionaceae bacterium]
MAINIIDKDSLLESLLTFIKSSNFLSVDTEFNRQKSFEPMLGLFQICTQGEIFLIDPLKVTNFYKLIKSLVYTDAIVMFHAHYEDASIISSYARKYKLSKFMCSNLYDSQIAAAFLNKGMTLGLSSLLKDYLGISLEKKETLTDWLARPFSEAQIEYAAFDVAYLEKLHSVLSIEFSKKAFVYELFQREMQECGNYYNYDVNMDALHVKLPKTGRFSENKLRILKEITRYRYELCKKNNMALSRFMKNQVLVNLVDTMQITNPKLYISNGVHYSIAKEYGYEISQIAINAINNINIPVIRTFDSILHIGRLKELIKNLSHYLERVAKKLEISEDLIASKRYIAEFMYNSIYKNEFNIREPAFLEKGWRGEILTDLEKYRPIPQKL